MRDKRTDLKPKRSNTRWILTLLIVAILTAAGFVWWRFFYIDANTRTLLASFSQLDFSGTEPQVVNKIKLLQEQVKSNPRTGRAWGKLAMNLDAHDFKNESLPIYMKAAKLDPDNFRWSYFLAIVFSELGNQESLEWFKRAEKIDPDYVPLLVKYGDALDQFGKKDLAVQKYTQALAFDPQSAHALYGLTRISFAEGDLQSSRKHLVRILEINPNFGEAYNLLVSVCRQQNDTECVAKNSAIASRLTEKTDITDSIYGELVAEGESSIWYSFRGTQYFKNGLYDAAITQFQTALRLRPDAQSHEDLAKTFSSAGRFSEAAEHYRLAIDAHPVAENYFGMGVVLAKMERYPEAQEYFQKAIEKKKDYAEAYLNLAVTYAKMKQMPEVVENLKQAVRINPEYAQAHFYLGQTYLALRNRDEAMREYKILSNLDPAMASELQVLIEKMK
jgi:tetratricopeptide (TPR) repeat protein